MLDAAHFGIIISGFWYLEAVGLITTGGLSAGGITIDVDPASKIGMSFLMIFGRLEIIAVIYIFYPRLAA